MGGQPRWGDNQESGDTQRGRTIKVGGASGGDSERFSQPPPKKNLAQIKPPPLLKSMTAPNFTEKRPASRRLRKHRNFGPGIYFVTKCLHPRIPVLRAPAFRLIVASLQFCVERGDVWVSSFVILPEHLHLLCSPRDRSLSAWMHDWMSFVAAKTASALRPRGVRWQDGFYDTEIRTGRQYAKVIDYIHGNPVRKGLVARPDQWEFSSIHGQPWLKCLWGI